ncbi:hypothetical protein [Granulicella arctica]|uniref:hypothetical protein n=1 Tax=Granulicella arctica TaxID=940613 RepID=UPI0021E0174A|nr:hypothetical protein [Granulicella arctica]
MPIRDIATLGLFILLAAAIYGIYALHDIRQSIDNLRHDYRKVNDLDRREEFEDMG